MAQLAVSVGPWISEPTEQHTLAMRLVNRGSGVCVVDGYPRVTLSDSRGAIDFTIRDGGDQVISHRPPKPVRLQPGGTADLLLNKNVCVNGSRRAATKLELETPAGGATTYTFPAHMPFPWRIPDFCTAATDPGRIISVSPFVPTWQAAIDLKY
jgi:hypothetical protein